MNPKRKTSRWLAVEVAALIALLTVWVLSSADDVPQVRWSGGAGRSAVEPMATLPTEFPLSLEIDLQRPMHVYVASHDTVRGTIAMFPSTMLRSGISETLAMSN